MYGIQFVDDIKSYFLNNNIGTNIYWGAKVLALLIFAVHLYYTFWVQAIKDRPKLDRQYIFEKVFLLAVIFAWADFYNLFLSLFSWLEGVFPVSEPKPKEIFLRMIGESNVEIDDSWTTTVEQSLMSIRQIFEDPEILISIVLNFVTGIADIIVYVYFLIKQYFFGLILGVVSPIMLTLSMFKIKAFGDYWTRIIKYNIIAILMLPCFYVANLMGELAYTMGKGDVVDVVWSIGETTTAPIEADPTILLLTVFIKYGLMKTSNDLLFKFLG